MAASMTGKTSKLIRHLGRRPKADQDNHCREKLCELVRDVGCFYEIYPEKLYLVYLAKDESAARFCDHANDAKCPFIFWSMHDSPTLNYEAFNMDFGPFNLAMTHLFCSRLKVWFDTIPYRDSDKHVVIVLDDLDLKKKLNATLLVAIAAMVLLDLTADQVLARLGFFMMPKIVAGKKHKDLVFRQRNEFSDVSGSQSVMRLTIEDCIHAFYAALQNKFYSYYEFDHTEYVFYETVMSGDLNWVVPGKLLAFAGPCDGDDMRDYHHKQSPKFYHDYFSDHNVTTIIRLNDELYKSSGFKDFGFDHHDLIFPDGYPPTSTIASKFIRIVDEAKGAVAVHCYAGIGRTGTLIAAYLMVRYNFTPQMAIAWTRICRPGSVVGEQQDWLFCRFNQYSHSECPSKQAVKSTRKAASDPSKLPDVTTPEPVECQSNKTYYEAVEQTLGQARALVMTKRNRECADKPCTRNTTAIQRRSPDGPGHHAVTKTATTSTTKKVDVILDLGMTIPFSIPLEDLLNRTDGGNPDYYRIKENQYEWKVKFPKTGYVALKHDRKKDLEAVELCGLNVREVIREPVLDFRYDFEDHVEQKDSNDKPTTYKKKPVVYFTLVARYDSSAL